MTTEVRLSREMRLLDITMIGVGAMIGAGIFVLTGIAAGVAGPALMVVFLLNGFVALLTAAAYAELGSAVHGAGGGYLWIKASLPDPSGFLVGLGLALGNIVAARVELTLEQERLPRAGLMAGFAKASVLSVVAALALWELNFGREIVLAAFLIGFGAIGVAFALAVGLGTANAIRAGWQILLERNKDE